MNTKNVKKLYDKYVLNTYFRQDLCLVKGRDSFVWDISGKKYLDFFPGWAVSGIGHSNKYVVKSIKEQSGRILHVSNNYYSDVQAKLAKVIIDNSFKGKVFFANSGAEANEAAIKLARKYGNPGKYEIITMERSFHGRTIATITATGQEKVKTGFSPLPGGFVHVPFNDLDAVKAAVTEKTVAVMLEPVQGEGGVNVASMEFIKGLRELCDEKGMLLIFDEVQTGMGRTGKMFCFEHYGITPDVMTLAKSLGGGLPIGAMVVSDKYSGVLTPGTHASTFGGSPIVCAGSLGVFEAIKKEKMLKNAVKIGKYLVGRLNSLKGRNPVIKNVKGLALMIGVELDVEDGSAVYRKCLEKGLLINCTQKNILRIMPPLNVKKGEIDKALNILEDVIKGI